MNQETVQICLECIAKNQGDFTKVKFSINEDESSAGSYTIAELEDPYADAINSFLARLADSFDDANKEKIETTELILNHVDQKYLHYFIGYFDLKEQLKQDEFKAKLLPKKMASEPTPTKKLSKLDYLIQKDEAAPVRKAIPLSITKLHKIVIERCYMKTINFQQLNSLFLNTLYLKELDLTNIFKSIQKDVPLDLVNTLQVITVSSCG